MGCDSPEVNVGGETVPVQEAITEVQKLQLLQLRKLTWDGDLMSKVARSELVAMGLAERAEGWTFLTKAGVEYLHRRGLLHA